MARPAWTPLYPPGPYPPHGTEAPGTVDMGVRLRDALYTRSLLVGPVRRVLLDTVRRALATRERLVMSLEHIDAFIDTWPLGAMIDGARERWTEGPSGEALVVLSRATEVLGPVLGWPQMVDRRWPLPDEEWMRQQLDEDTEYAVISRGPRDGSPAVAVALNLPMGPPEPVALPKYLRVPGDRLAARVDELLHRADSEGVVAIEFSGYTPHDIETARARDVLRNHLSGQSAMEAYGLAGLVCGSTPHWDSVLGSPAQGTLGERPRALAEGLIVPAFDSQQKVVDRGVLVWDAAIRPVKVHPAAIEVLYKLDGNRTLDEVSASISAPDALVDEVVRQLVQLGAATC